MLPDSNNNNWSAEDSAETYRLEDWNAGHFSINQNGNLEIVCQVNGTDVRVSIMDIIKGMQDRDLFMPALIRVENILDHSLKILNEAFKNAIDNCGYQNVYRGVFPIKVNQQAQIIEEIVRFGQPFNHGLEAGSKPELIIALAMLENEGSYIVCNGYKDEEFIDLGLRAIQLGYKCFFVIETPTEVPVIIRRAKALGVKPMLGTRVKLSTRVEGHWQKDSGDRSIFGLNSLQIIEVIDMLKEADMLDCLQLLHFHLGSQIPSIHNIRRGVQEACRYYVSMKHEGAAMQYMDVGGGLAVDYEGNQQRSLNSKNYTLDEYCSDILETIMMTLDPEEIDHPVIISESGRATAAYSSIFLFNILDVAHFDPVKQLQEPPQGSDEKLKNLREVLEVINPDNLQECYNDANYYRDEIRHLFQHGQVGLRERAIAENLYLEVLQHILKMAPEAGVLSEEVEQLQQSLTDIYYGNFSVFQSLPDAWAINQVFPIMPVHRLDEKPTRQATIADLTCDCDGKLDHFIGDESTLPLHELRDGEDYYLGTFLVGAYQETLSDLHNLFGDTNVVSIRINEDGSFEFVHEIEGDTIEDVLDYVEYDIKAMKERFRRTVERAVREDKITVKTRQQILKSFAESLTGYTYYEVE
jgi:arginine decarboxylase